MSTWHGVMADEEKLSRRKISTDTVYNTLKTHTKYAYIIRGRPTLRDVERFRYGSVREPYKRSLYERTFMSEPFIEKHAKTHRACRRDCEPSRIPEQSLKRLRNKSRKDKPIIALKKNLGKCKQKKQSLFTKKAQVNAHIRLVFTTSLGKKEETGKDFGYFRSFWARLMVQLLFLS